ncbi:MAG: ATP-binding protein [Pseudomonadota bacterium]
MRIRAYLALMVAAILVPVILFAATSLNMLLRAERESALRGVRETARIALVSLDRELSNTTSSVRMLATSHFLQMGELGGFYGKAKFADKLNSGWTMLLDEDGKQLINTTVPYGAPLPPLGDDARVARVQRALKEGEPQVSNLVRGEQTAALHVMVDVPVTTPTGRRYVISQGFDVAHFAEVLNHVNLPPTWLAGVFDRNGIMIAQTSSHAQAGTPRADLREAIRGGAVGVIRNVNDGDLRLFSVLERSTMSGWTVAIGVPEAEIEAAARRALKVAIFGLIAAIGCATAAAVFFGRRLSLSIGIAARSARALEHSEPVASALASGVFEVDELQAAIVAAALVICDEKQSRLLAESERELLYASEHSARTMAERQNRAKDEFLAMLGHELRNPLSAIMNATSVMGQAAIPAEASEGARQIIARQSQHLARIVDDLLDVSRVHSGKILLDRRALRLDMLVQTHCAALKGTQRAAQHHIGIESEPAWVEADPTRLEQILSNLVDNALKYTPAGGSIDIQVGMDGAQVVLAVRDTGIGIGPELMPYVFDLFVQGTRTLDRTQGGLGVGLALVWQLAAMHGGRVSARSEGEGRGSVFEMRLPAVAPGSEVAPIAAPLSSRHSVLLIEDNEDGREMMAMMLEAQHYRVATAIDGLDGLRKAAELQPDIALVDIGLPGIDGYEVARRLRADPRTCELRLVALTGYGQESDQQRALDAGFDAHLVKPVALERLLEVLEAPLTARV